MNISLELLLIIILAILCYQDIKERKVSLFILVLGIVVGGFTHYLNQEITIFLYNILVNSLFVMIVFGILIAYSKWKMKTKIFDVFGVGDLFFFILLAVSLPILSFLIVFIFSLIFSLAIFISLKKRFKDSSVPLAGLQSLFFIIVLLFNRIVKNLDLYSM
ncbi:prepilin peptidase [Polaribacter cellanae]|uniref:Prepilin peptidase n=1 Tax=Polaribacter cellanae TaxID=2818493 RepID=A0A975CK40_9FLAO|nr:prepilin peptidase [Polaribacter cellanae]QTE21143.1 prepilin peptidase [Polaribacter cellanae]